MMTEEIQAANRRRPLNQPDATLEPAAGYLDDSAELPQALAALHGACVLDLARIVADPNQPRKHFDQEELESLARSIQADGVLQPIRVRWDADRDRYVILMGERRFRAAELAGLTRIPAILHDGPLTEADRRRLALVENLHRAALNPIEQARAFQDLLDLDRCSSSRLARELHVAVSTVTRAVSLLKLPIDIQEAVAGGKVPAAVAWEVARLGTEEEQRALVQRYFTEGLTSATVAAAVRGNEGKPGKGKDGKDKDVKILALLHEGRDVKITIEGLTKPTLIRQAELIAVVLKKLTDDGRGKKTSSAKLADAA